MSVPDEQPPQLTAQRRGNVVNIPLPYFGLGDHEYSALLETLVLPILAEWGPEMIFISCGFDAAHGDPLGGMCITPAGYEHMTSAISALNPPRGLVVALEGGYNVDSISASAEAVVRALLKEWDPDTARSHSAVEAPVCLPSLPLLPPRFLHPAALQCMRNVAAAQAPFFKCMALLDSQPERLLPSVTDAHASRRPSSGASDDDAGSAAVGDRFVIPVDHAFDHQRRRKTDFSKHIEPAPDGKGWLTVTYARSHFPRKITYKDFPVQDLHLYLLLAPLAPELIPRSTSDITAAAESASCAAASVTVDSAKIAFGGDSGSGVTSVVGIDSSAVEAMTAVVPSASSSSDAGTSTADADAAKAADVVDDLLSGLTSALGSLSIETPAYSAEPSSSASLLSSVALTAETCPPQMTASASSPPPSLPLLRITSPLSTTKPSANADVSSAPRSQACSRAGRARSPASASSSIASSSASASVSASAKGSGSAASGSAGPLTRARRRQLAAEESASATATASAPACSLISDADSARFHEAASGILAAAPRSSSGVHGGVSSNIVNGSGTELSPTSSSAAAVAASPALSRSSSGGAFWKPFGPAQAWIQVERLYASKEAAQAALSSGGAGASTPPAASAAANAQQERHFLVISDMLGRQLLKLRLAKPPAAASASSSSKGSVAADVSMPLRLRGQATDPQGIGLFPPPSRHPSGRPPTPAAADAEEEEEEEWEEWTLRDCRRADPHGESRVLVLPGCADAYEAYYSQSASSDGTPPLVGWVPVVPTSSRMEELRRSLRQRSRSLAHSGGEGLQLPPTFRPGDYAPLAARLYFGDERDDDKVEEGRFVGQEPAAAFAEQLQAKCACGH